ncbi:uncharacterized protein N7511_001986 [Penicillium nucicola]|uniref:uncharacterized protein n=1 Tax=Penicillium nucicola TaxID=1850975 RepID=UPI0025451635|nr:uncharacterized protein N7511_001986 [Penicillium nucicola]KAJ5769935.1 hypothetical protein N7511_001986 [Penicillium nucicola]
MFGNRRNSQKPDEGLINKFQATFSDIVRPTRCDPPGPTENNENSNYRSARGTPGLRFTPLLNDQSGLRFSPFLDDQFLLTPNANHTYQNYNPSSSNTVFHGPAGDLHTPLVDSSLMTPKTLLEQFAVTPLHRNNIDPFQDVANTHSVAQEPQTIAPVYQHDAYPPSAFDHSHLAHSTLDGTEEAMFPSAVNNQQTRNPQLVTPQDSHSPDTNHSSHNDQQFRYQVTLNTPTAMMNDPKHPPITYLNKAQIYPLSIVDSAPPLTNDIVRYKSWIRVTFDDDEQASNPAASWALWKEARGHEAYQKDGNLYAIEFVGLFPEKEGQTCDHIQLESIALDGFCVSWYSDPASGRRGCSMGVRFHFLSTDFSHIKGVKGASIKLCAKTETIGKEPAELSCCKVKLFREHGAERKMFNDVSQLKRAIERRRHDFGKVENGGDSLGKRKRGSRFASYKSDKELEEERRDQLQKSLDDELAMMQKRFYSNRPVTVFHLPGNRKDDPELFPINMADNVKQEDDNKVNLQASTVGNMSSKLSINSTDHRTPGLQKDAIPPIPEPTTGQADSKPAASVHKAPVACFYLRFQKSYTQQDDYHTAVYLTERTAKELMTKISQKQRFTQDHILHLFQVKNGMKVIIDDDVVQRIPDGQDMIAEISEINNTASGGGSTVEVRLDF